MDFRVESRAIQGGWQGVVKGRLRGYCQIGRDAQLAGKPIAAKSFVG